MKEKLMTGAGYIYLNTFMWIYMIMALLIGGVYNLCTAIVLLYVRIVMVKTWRETFPKEEN